MFRYEEASPDMLNAVWDKISPSIPAMNSGNIGKKNIFHTTPTVRLKLS